MSTLPASPFVVPEVVAEGSTAAMGATRGSRVMHSSIGLAAVCVIGAALLLRVEEGTRVTALGFDRALPELCYWRTMFGMDCPGCGLTRCFIAAAHGHLAEAWSYNPVGLLLFAAVVFQIPYRAWQLWRLSTGRDEFQTFGAHYALLGVSALLIVQWCIRLML